MAKKRKAIIAKSVNGQYWYTLRGDNGEILMTSELIKSKANVKKVLGKYFPDFPIKDKTKKP